MGLNGVPDVHASLADQRLEPLTAAVARVISADALRLAAGAALAASDAASARTLDAAVAAVVEPLREVEQLVPDGAGQTSLGSVEALVDSRLRSLVTRVRAARKPAGASAPETDDRELADWLGTRRDRWALLVGWLLSDAVLRLASASPAEQARAFDGWAVDRALGDAVRALGLDDPTGWRIVELVRAMVALGSADSERPAADEDMPRHWFEEAAVRSAAGWNAYQGASFVTREAYAELLEAVAARDALLAKTRSFATARSRAAAAARAGYQLSAAPPSGQPSTGDTDGDGTVQAPSDATSAPADEAASAEEHPA
jgi:hypothetical protein